MYILKSKQSASRMHMQLASLVFLSLGTAVAAPRLFTNPGFESASLTQSTGNGSFSQLVPGGTFTGWKLAFISTATSAGGFTPVNGGPNWTSTWWGGSNVAYLQIANQGDTVSLGQTLSDTLLLNETYTLSALVGNRSFSSLQDYSIQLLAGAMVIASTSNHAALASDTSGSDSLVYNSGAANALAGQTLSVRLTATGLAGSSSGNYTEVFFDNVGLDASATTPEPGSYFGGLLGLAASFAAKRFRTVRSAA